MIKVRSRSPLKDKPLRNPGQSLENQQSDLAYDKILAPGMMALFLCIIAGLEWWAYLYPRPRNPVVYSVMALLAVAYAAIQLLKVRPKLRALRLARDGEKAVGQFLERLREQGYQVFHDVLGDGFNVDHVLVGPAGVFTVETKTFSKPARGEAKISFDGERILVDGLEPDRNPVVQAKAQAGWLRDLLAASTGRKITVRPVILFPGWFIEQKGASTREIWVLNPKALPDFLNNKAESLAPEDVQLASYHLSRYIRERERT